MFSELYDYLKNLSTSKLYGFLMPTNLTVEKLMKFYLTDIETEKTVFQFTFSTKNIKTFVDELKLDKNVLKAVIIDCFGVDVQGTCYKSRYEFRTSLKKKLNDLQIPNAFVYWGDATFAILIAGAQINLQQNEQILLAINMPDFCLAALLKFTPHGYEIISSKRLESDICRTQFFGAFNPAKIILFEKNEKESVKEFLDSEKLIILKGNVCEYFEPFIVESCKHILDKSYIKCHILQEYRNDISFSCYYGKNFNRSFLYNLKVDDDKLPFSKCTIFQRTVTGCSVSFSNEKDSVIEKDAITFGPNLDRNCHRFKATLSVDVDSLESCQIEKLTLDSIRKLPYKFDRLSEPAIIGLFDNSSVIFVHDEYIGYDFLKSWNGIYGKDLFMSFDQKKPKYFDQAWNKLEDRPSFVVFDLLRIMSMPSDQIQISDAWGFTTTKDVDNPILLEFDNFDGTRKAATPSFLMAVFIRKHLEAIRDENGGEKPTKIAFWILNDLNGEKQFNDDQMKRIKAGLEEACNLLNVKCKFVAC